ncbi:MAG TPA: tRNA pseudouridine(55) synthase TruB [Spirochaetota bacterium]|nr:tRNA pseudouridine(55) synthase TruB [Spirochaetota bacterium]HOM38067.1 tRNA pseudouridine(55) synthase TruB [Spirochaetota bacterium]HPQ48870.1 tRNA pseudouridine(55) synthase TruB [Spirochaetota bacterium]
MDGILLIDKNEGISSFETIEKVKLKLGLKKIGHAGTLDPFATGLLIACTDRATPLTQIFLECDKLYETDIVFGEKRETDDITSEVKEKSPYIPSLEEVETALKDFIGEILQTPPKYSAIKINGQRAYKIAREGKDPILKPRKVTLYSAKIIDYKKPVLKLLIHCSSGFYIRSLARDLGEKLKTFGYVASLKRKKIGKFELSNAKKIEEITINNIIKVENATDFLPEYKITEKEKNFLIKNNKINLNDKTINNYQRVYDLDIFLGIINKEGSFIYRDPNFLEKLKKQGIN